ncbi:unnamed protein product [Oreochromis niloticus]|nr:unnamed protein product [Mustela putorius furo]
MVAKYPNSLQDVKEGDIVGAGYLSLVKQLQNRIENVRRTSTPKIRKRKHQTDSDHTDEIPLEERAGMQDTYGCIKWNVEFLPLEETPESQQQKMEKLKVMFQQADANPDEVKSLMKSTYYTQRQHVNQGKSIKCLKEEWPFWFDELGMSVQFKELTGIDLIHTKFGFEGEKASGLHDHSCCQQKQGVPSDLCKASEDAGTAEWLLR